MPSSRWKRFAFFDRHSLNLASEVLEDLIPIGGGGLDGTRASRRSVHALAEAAAEASDDVVSLVVTTAALPLNSKPPPFNSDVHGGGASGINRNKESADYALALNDMWSSVAACNPIDLPGGGGAPGNGGSAMGRNIRLPSQAQTFEDDSNVASSGTAVDGLVLVFVTSQDTDLVHCFDVTVRCNPPPPNPSTTEKDLEDLDGWRGYIAPLKGQARKPNKLSARDQSGGSAAAARTMEERIIAEHLAAGGGGSKEEKEGIVGIATCRANSGHRPVHMACVTMTNVVVCVDPHLYLSW
jgi:hypothetical protein